MAYRDASLTDPHLPVYSRDHIVPFWVSIAILAADLDDTDITGLYTFPPNTFIKNVDGSVAISFLADPDVAGTALRVNLVVLDSDDAVDFALNSDVDPVAGIVIPSLEIDGATGLGWIDVSDVQLGLEIETAADGTETAVTLEVYGEYACGVKRYAA